MKLYIKANSLKILKNLDTILPYATSKTNQLLDTNSNQEYLSNIKSAKEIQKYQKTYFYDTRELKQLIKGVYFGNSYCEHLLPAIKEIAEAKAFCENRHFNFVFVFAPMSQSKTKEVEYICETLSQKPNSEVVINDFGTLYNVLKYKNLKPILGLNFTKTIKNAFLDSIKQNDISSTQLQNQKRLLSHIEFENKSVREFYTSLNIRRFAIENIALSLDFLDEAPKMYVDFYYPNITISNSRACDIAGMFEDKRRYFAYDECPKYCNFASLEFEHSDVLGLYQRYTTIYKIDFNLNIPKIVYKNPKNRFVWEIFV